MEKVLFNYFEMEGVLKKFRNFSETDSDIAPLFNALEAQFRRDEFLCKADKEKKSVVFGNEHLSSSVRKCYYELQRAFKEYYGLVLPGV